MNNYAELPRAGQIEHSAANGFATDAAFFLNGSVLLGCNDAEMGPTNLLNPSVYKYSEHKEKLNFIFEQVLFLLFCFVSLRT